MGESSESAKVAKKSAKAQAKVQKKLAKAAAEREVPLPKGATSPDSDGTTAAERSAAAAERQVILQRYRVWLSLVLALIAVATFVFTVKPWTLFTGQNSGSLEPPTSTDASHP